MNNIDHVSEQSTIAALHGWGVWEVFIGNNYYNGRYSTFSYRGYEVIATSAEQARKIILLNADLVLEHLKTKRYGINQQRKVISVKAAVPITPRLIAKSVESSITITQARPMISPDGVIAVETIDGAIVGFEYSTIDNLLNKKRS